MRYPTLATSRAPPHFLARARASPTRCSRAEIALRRGHCAEDMEKRTRAGTFARSRCAAIGICARLALTNARWRHGDAGTIDLAQSKTATAYKRVLSTRARTVGARERTNSRPRSARATRNRGKQLIATAPTTFESTNTTNNAQRQCTLASAPCAILATRAQGAIRFSRETCPWAII